MNPAYIKCWGLESDEYVNYKKTFKKLPLYTTKLEVSNRHYRCTKSGFVFDTWFLRAVYETRNMDVKPNDIFVMSFPKTGTTWLQEIVYAIISDLNFDESKSQTLTERFPCMEVIPGAHKLNTQKPRLLMSHLPYSFLPLNIIRNKPKILYICRNPKDTLVSMFHFYKLNTKFGFEGSFKEFFHLFLNEEVMYSPFAKHVLEFWNKRNEENICFLQYEQLHKDTINQIQQIATFLGKQLTTDQANQVAHHCCFDNMAKTPTMNYQDVFKLGVYNSEKGNFIRKGKIGDFRTHFDSDMNNQMDDWIETRFKDTGLTFEYE